jgi:2-keto-4-pentenoate hydratase/2-oxohepta-3-ene-1,7-dioic acid hydratase in catechol pathway
MVGNMRFGDRTRFCFPFLSWTINSCDFSFFFFFFFFFFRSSINMRLVTFSYITPTVTPSVIHPDAPPLFQHVSSAPGPASHSHNGPSTTPSHIGVQLSNSCTSQIVDLTKALKAPHLTMSGLISTFPQGRKCIDEIVASGDFRVDSTQIRLRAPISDSTKIVCVGMNYRDHCEEMKMPVPTEPIIFSKYVSTITDPGDNISAGPTNELDFEVELAVVIGPGAGPESDAAGPGAGKTLKICKNVKKEDAHEFIAGYTIAHDVSARDWQLKRNGKQWGLGKTFDTYAPIGPAIVTIDDPELKDACNTGIRSFVNGKVMQDSNTNQLVFGPADIIAWVTRFFTLNPGDLLFTGTPPGIGAKRDPPQFLKPGDVVRCEIDGIGSITNKIVE